MTRKILLASAALLLALSGAAAAQTAPPRAPMMAPQPIPKIDPRAATAGIADAIAGHYWDPVKGAKFAADLNAAAAKGEFDALTDPRDLATILTNLLKPIDHHFNVTWRPVDPNAPPPPPQSERPDPADIARFEAADRRVNFGFRRVEILPGDIGYIDLRQFADFDPTAANPAARDAADAALALVGGADAVIIDLRDNGGGSPAMVGYLASAFVAPGSNIYNTFHFRGGTESEAPLKPFAKPRLDAPLYILTSARTGSAAESLAYTLQQAGRAVIVGDPSGGAANPGGPVPAGNGFSIFVSGGSPENPITHTNWEGVGVQPNQAVPAAQALVTARRLALVAVLAKAPEGPFRTESQWALEALDAEARPPVAPAADLAGAYSGVAVSVNAEGVLEIRRGQRPPVVLMALGGDIFSVRGEPDRRLTFERDGKGGVTALVYLTSDGPGPRYRRDN
jgi:hypothetical protein